VVYFLSGVLV